MIRLATFILSILLFLQAMMSVVLAQEEAEKSRFITFIEEQLSTDNMQIRLNGIQGTLSSDVSFDSITIADEDGIWLTIAEPRLLWSRSSLLRGRLEVEKLSAASIDMPRGPKPDESAPAPESGSFSLPELPVAINLEELSVPSARFGQSVFGLEAEISLDGAIALEVGSLTTKLDIVRIDGPGGSLNLAIEYDGAAENINLDVKLQEPDDGIIANLLNLDGRPPVALEIAGDAPINDLLVELSFDVDQQRIMSGDLRLDGTADGMRINANLGGPLASILPDEYADLIGQESRFSLAALRQEDGQLDLNQLTLISGAIDLKADANLLADGFLSSLNLDASISNRDGERIVLPGSQTPISFADALLSVRYDAAEQSRLNQTLLLQAVEAEGFSISRINLDSNGVISDFNDATQRALTFTSTGSLSGIAATDTALAQAIGENIQIEGSGMWKSGDPLSVSAFDIVGASYALRTTGAIQSSVFDGQIGLEATNLASFALLSDRDLSGSLGLVASGQIEPLTGAFDLTFNGTGNGLQTGTATVDKLLNGSSNLSGGIKRASDGLTFNRFRVTNNQADILIDGQYASELADLRSSIELRNLADISDSGSGAVSATAQITGQKQPYDAVVQLQMPRGSLSNKTVQDLALGFTGTIGADRIAGSLSGGGSIDAQSVSLSGNIDRDAEQLQIDSLAAVIGEASLQADLTRNNLTGLMDGKIDVKATDIAAVAALALQDASGGLSAKIGLVQTNGSQSADISATASNLSFNRNRIGSAEIEAEIASLLSQPQVNAQIAASNMLLSGIAVEDVDGNITTNGNETLFDLNARLAQENARIQTKGRLLQQDNEQQLFVEALNLQSSLGNANLSAPTSIVLRDGRTVINSTQINVAGGQIGVEGTVTDNLAIQATINRLPLNIANAFNPALGLGGSVSGRLAVDGPTSTPRVNFNLTGAAITARQLLQAQISPLTLSTNGVFDAGAQRVSLNQLSVSNAQSIQVQGGGQIPLSGNGLNFAADGTAPLEIAEQFLASRGAQISGQARFNITATGNLGSPNLNGLLSVSGGTLSDPLSNLRLTDIGLIAGLNGDVIAIQRFGARLSGGGSIDGSGTVGIAGELPADLNITLNSAGYSDGQTFATTVNGQLKLGGNLLRDPVLSGQIDVGETEITVPESFASGSTLLQVSHNQPDQETQQTLDRIAEVSPIPKPSARPSILQLDLSIVAPNRIFVRGRGLDAELGGRLVLRGPTTNITPSGRFDLRRGRLSLLGQRFDIDEGSVTLAGSLDPILFFVVQTVSGDVTAFITLSGRTSDLQVSFTSDPELPEDEVLALIIFGKSLTELSPTQIARLASIAAELTGGNSPGLVDELRGGLGLDDLDIVQDSDGNAAVKVGKYINDNVYLGVQTGQETEATINLDITDSLTARGSVDSEGETELGIFFERDY